MQRANLLLRMSLSILPPPIKPPVKNTLGADFIALIARLAAAALQQSSQRVFYRIARVPGAVHVLSTCALYTRYKHSSALYVSAEAPSTAGDRHGRGREHAGTAGLRVTSLLCLLLVGSKGGG